MYKHTSTLPSTLTPTYKYLQCLAAAFELEQYVQSPGSGLLRYAQDAPGHAVQPLRKLHIQVPRCGTTDNKCFADTIRLLLLRSFGMQRRHIACNAYAARETTSLRHPLHCRSNDNGTSGSDHRLHQVGNSLCLPHHSQFKIKMVRRPARRLAMVRLLD